MPATTLRFAADENFNENIVRGLLRRMPELDILTICDAGLSGKTDPAVLEWAADEDRILLTHDVTTMTKYAYERVERGLSMPGVFEIKRTTPLLEVIESLLLIVSASEPEEWEGRVVYLPL